jgi:hypothetical protein
MSNLRHLVRLLGVPVIEACLDPGSLDWMLVATIGEPSRKLLLLERTYREGIRIVEAPTDSEIAACRTDPWRVWNTKRAVFTAELNV